MPRTLRNGPSRFSSPTFIMIVLLVVSLVLATLYVREGNSGVLHGMQAGMSAASSPIKSMGGAVSGAADAVGTSVSDVTANDSTLSGLREQNEQLRDTVSKLEEYRQEAQRLQGLLNLRDTYGAQGTTCRVISRSTDAWNKVVTIDGGTDGNVHAGMPVLGNNGVVGQVISATASTADVRLITDSRSGVAVMIQSSRAQGILRGSLEGLLYLEDVDNSVEVNTGDVVITSGLGGGYYSGLTIGTVVKITKNQGDSTRQIVVQPNTTTGPLEEVLVVSSMTESSGVSSTSSSSSSSSSSSTGGDAL